MNLKNIAKMEWKKPDTKANYYMTPFVLYV